MAQKQTQCNCYLSIEYNHVYLGLNVKFLLKFIDRHIIEKKFKPLCVYNYVCCTVFYLKTLINYLHFCLKLNLND